MIFKLFRKISKRNSDIHARPNRNENGVEKFIEAYLTYQDPLANRY